MNIRNGLTSLKVKTGAALAVLATPFVAFAADDPATVATTKITALETGIVSVGGAILGITLAAVGFFVIRRLVNRA